jgi:hypothetical protein
MKTKLKVTYDEKWHLKYYKSSMKTDWICAYLKKYKKSNPKYEEKWLNWRTIPLF